MSDSACIPAFAEHRDGNDAPDLLAETALDTNGIDHFSKEVFIGELIRLPAVAGTLDSLTTENLDLVGRRGAKVPVERLAGIQLLTIDEQRAWPRQRSAGLIEVAEEVETPLFKAGRAVRVGPAEPRDVVVDQLRGGRVVANHDKARRNANTSSLPASNVCR